MGKEIEALKRNLPLQKAKIRTISIENFQQELSKNWSIHDEISSEKIVEITRIIVTIKSENSIVTVPYNIIGKSTNAYYHLVKDLKTRGYIKKDAKSIRFFIKTGITYNKEIKDFSNIRTGQQIILKVNQTIKKIIKKNKRICSN